MGIALIFMIGIVVYLEYSIYDGVRSHEAGLAIGLAALAITTFLLFMLG